MQVDGSTVQVLMDMQLAQLQLLDPLPFIPTTLLMLMQYLQMVPLFILLKAIMPVTIMNAGYLLQVMAIRLTLDTSTYNNTQKTLTYVRAFFMAFKKRRLLGFLVHQFIDARIDHTEDQSSQYSHAKGAYIRSRGQSDGKIQDKAIDDQ